MFDLNLDDSVGNSFGKTTQGPNTQYYYDESGGSGLGGGGGSGGGAGSGMGGMSALEAMRLRVESGGGSGLSMERPSVVKWELRSGVSSTIGRREEMEDVHVMIDCMGYEEGGEGGEVGEAGGGEGGGGEAGGGGEGGAGNSRRRRRPNTAFYAVFDGHSGVQAAEYVSERLVEMLMKDEMFWSTKSTDVTTSLVRNFELVDAEYLALCDEHNVKINPLTNKVYSPFDRDWM